MNPISRRDLLRASGGPSTASEELAFSSATDLAQLIQRKQVSSFELTQHYIERIEQFDKALNAVVVRDFERALEAAKSSDESLARGHRLGPLHGVPMTIKEAFDVSGLPTTWGVPEQRANLALNDATVVERLKAAGAHFMGKTNVPLRLADWQSYNDIYGTTNNPWDTRRSPGGSSGGSAAALAAGLTGLEFASDIGGSIRNPSHFCGVYGHKPTYGIVPTLGHNPHGVVSAPDLNVVGPMARCAEDLELALDVVAGPDRFRSPGWRLVLPPPKAHTLRGLRVAIWPKEDSVPTSTEISDRVQEVGEVLARAGAIVSDLARPEISPGQSHNTYLSLLGSSGLANLPDDYYSAISQMAAELDANDESPLAVLARARVLDHRSWCDHDEARTNYRLRWRAFFNDWDVVICPISATTAYEHDHRPRPERVLAVDAARTSHYEHYFWVGLATVAYLPSTAFPSGLSSEGLPIGLQIIGPEYGDRTTIEVARLIAQEFGGFQAPAGFGA
ncbi:MULTISPECIES: amidase [unclassified Lysobacter]|uniref:amidase n=1 Tax=unclassified Lysobacter TaxID=2635362 RepID=UPI001BE7FB17|nr:MULTISPECIES: amidase [unclassified Lysobacter]MBT2747594.1 amidase [Lysobacter sp. ISL-42]MBT2752417.1 amidase [Lysobacter sp. ISL-50]MBT2776164.1 amidase [Lysobacter sp. ISL-54]MBT2784248.1 amidase [Lysobacter sp. ISL-52]